MYIYLLETFCNLQTVCGKVMNCDDVNLFLKIQDHLHVHPWARGNTYLGSSSDSNT